MMTKNPLIELQKLGQSVWLDNMARHMIVSGTLKKIIDEDGIQGITSNPGVFEKAIGCTAYYEKTMETLERSGKGPEEIYDILFREDYAIAADLLRPAYEGSHGRNGYVSIEVDPRLAYDPQGTVEEARRLWKALHRPNAMIKMPATGEGLIAIQQLISEGINVNVTLLFDLKTYERVQNAYLSGLEERLSKRLPLDGIRSVATFFISRIDLAVDQQLDQAVMKGGRMLELARELKGQAGVASAKAAYMLFKKTFSKEKFGKFGSAGATPQQLVWSYTDTKDSNVSNIEYIEALIAPDTISAVPLETLAAYRAHGRPKAILEEDSEKFLDLFMLLPETGIDMEEVSRKLLNEGVLEFAQSYERALKMLTKKIETLKR